ncbi:uncharacterized protein LOC115408167 [Tachysurus ichikawai]
MCLVVGLEHFVYKVQPNGLMQPSGFSLVVNFAFTSHVPSLARESCKKRGFSLHFLVHTDLETGLGWDAWAKVSALTVVRAFTKAGIIAEQPPGNETDSDNDEREPGMFDGEIAQLFNSDTEYEDFDGFVGED